MRALFEGSSYPMGLAKDGIQVMVNPAYLALFGYARASEVSGQPLLNDIAPDERPRLQEYARRRARGEFAPTTYETRGIKRDGTVFDLAVAISTYRRRGEVYTIGILRDITARKQTQEQLEILKRAVDSHYDGAYWMDVDNRFVFVNDTACRALGYARDELIGQSIAMINPRATPETMARVWQRLRAERVFASESVHRRKDGTEFPVDIVATHVRLGEREFNCGFARDITQRRKAEEATRESENRFRTAFMLGADAHIIVEQGDGRIIEVNDRFLELYGYTRSEVIGRTSLELGMWAVPEARRNLLAELDSHDQVENFEVLARRKGGETFWVLYSVSRLKIAGIPLLLGAIHDITVSKRTEAMLRHEQALFNSLTGSVPDAIYFKDRESRFIRINEALARRCGLSSPEAAVGRTDFDFFAGEHARQAFADEQRVMATGEPLIGIEEKETWLDGHITWVSTTKMPLRDGSGAITGLFGISRDITEQKTATERIREQAAMLDRANDVIYVTALDCTILYWNEAGARVYGWAASEALGRKTTELMCADLPEVDAVIATVIASGIWSGEQRQVTKTGRTVEVFSRMTLLRDDQGRPQTILVINSDITEKKQLEAKFMRAQRLESIGALASGVAHDLNNVLAPVIMGAPLLRESLRDDTARRMLALIETSARRGADIVRQVLTFARGTEGQRVSLRPKHLVREMVRMAEETFPKNVRVEEQLAAELWPVCADATQLHQVLMNLCVNARDAMPEGGSLTLAADNVTIDAATAAQTPGATAGPFVRLRVSDTGTGIPPELQERIFEPFFTTKGVGKGTGLGLSTALGIVKGHGGFIRLESQVGHGTTFELFLPAEHAVEPAPAPAAVAARLTPPGPRTELETVLLVDDEAAVREVARQALKEFGYPVLTSSSGAEAIRLVRLANGKVRLVVTDMMMPEMDGPKLVQALRVLAPAVPIVGITGVCDTATMQQLQALGLTALLAKPFTIDQLLAAVQAGLGTRPAAGIGAAPESRIA